MWIVKGLGLILAASLFFCIPLVAKKHMALKTANQYEGVVIGHKAYSANDGITYALEVQYQDSNLRKRTFENHPASNPPARKIGEKVRIFDYGDEQPPQVLAFQTMYLAYWVWFCLSFCALGCFVAPYLMRFIYIKN